MLKHTVYTLTLVAALCCTACGGDSPNAPSSSQPSATTFSFSGQVRDSSASGGPIPRLAAGTAFSGSYTFNPATTDSDPDPVVGLYVMPAPSGMTLQVGGVTVGSPNGLRIRVRNNVGGVEDDYEVQPNPQATDVRLRLFMRTRNLATLASDALLLEPPDIARFSDVHAPMLEVDGAGNQSLFVGVVDRLTR